MGGNGLTAPGIPHRAHHCHGCRERRKGAGKGGAGAQGVVQIEIFIPAFIQKGTPGSGLSCIYINAVVGVQASGRVEVSTGLFQAGRIHSRKGAVKIRWVSHTSGHTGIRIRSRRGFLRARQAGCLWPRLRGRDRLRRNGPTGRTGVCVRSIFQDDLCNG